MTTSVELTRAAEFQRSSRARGGLSGAEEEWRKAVRAKRPGDWTSAARDLRTSHQGTESCNKCTQRRSCSKCTQRPDPSCRARRVARLELNQRGTSETSARDDRRRYRSCRRARRPAALRKLSARETTGGTTEAVGAGDDRTRYGSCRRGTSGTSAERDQRREPPDERRQRGTSGTSAERDQRREPPDERRQRGTSETSAERD